MTSLDREVDECIARIQQGLLNLVWERESNLSKIEALENFVKDLGSNPRLRAAVTKAIFQNDPKLPGIIGIRARLQRKERAL
jgi:hypothetical protein